MNQKGQAVLEYILLLAIMVSISIALFPLISDKLAGPNGVFARQINIFSQEFSSNYKVFYLRR